MEENRSAVDRWRRLLIASWALVGLGVLLYVAGRLLGLVWPALTPLLLALVIVLLLRRPVALLEARRVPRVLAVVICYLIGTGVFVLVGVFLLPPLLLQLAEFLQAFPRYYDRANSLWGELQDTYETIRLPDWVNAFGDRIGSTLGVQLTRLSAAIATGAVAFGQTAVEFVLNVVLALVIAFYLLKDWPKLREELLLLFGARRREEASIVLAKVSTVLYGYLRGQLIVATAVGVLSAIGLQAIGVPYALVIGFITGIFNVVPYLGPLVGGAIAAISAAFVSPWLALWAIVVIFVVQQIDGAFISPRVMSEQVDLYPVLVIFSLLAGATLFGFVGMLLAIPVAAVAKGLFVYYFEKHTRSSLRSEEGVLFRQPKDECPPQAESCSEDEDAR